jgi:hypothetical protein
MPNPITSLPGYEAVRDLIPDGSFLSCTELWRFTLEHYRDECDALQRRMILELTPDKQAPVPDRVAVIMDSPVRIRFPDSSDILGLAFEDIRERGWEDSKWRVYDYEMSGLEPYCSSIRFERRTSTEQATLPNGGPAMRPGNSGAGGGSPSVS